MPGAPPGKLPQESHLCRIFKMRPACRCDGRDVGPFPRFRIVGALSFRAVVGTGENRAGSSVRRTEPVRVRSGGGFRGEAFGRDETLPGLPVRENGGLSRKEGLGESVLRADGSIFSSGASLRIEKSADRSAKPGPVSRHSIRRSEPPLRTVPFSSGRGHWSGRPVRSG